MSLVSFTVNESDVARINDTAKAMWPKINRYKKIAMIAAGVGGGTLLIALAAYLYGNSFGLLASLNDFDVPSDVVGSLKGFESSSVFSSELQGITSSVKGMFEGPLLKMLGVTAFLMGAGLGIAKQSIVPAIMGMLMAMTFTIFPSVIGSITGVEHNGIASAGLSSSGPDRAINFVETSLKNGGLNSIKSKLDEGSAESPIYLAYFGAQLSVKGNNQIPLILNVDALLANPKQINAKPEVQELLERKAYGKAKSEKSLKYEEDQRKSTDLFHSIATSTLILGITLLLLSGSFLGIWMLARKNVARATGSLTRTLEMLRANAGARN